ncbi:YbhB/YbcL family Raf kinase inhibitor-like protein [Streptomyces sp. NPDC096032]|uniref:YbhB/YbcL family Raf kinase inhibitor-like protein n=1 Tax=Streptomyces sp. NPDC096032 TaxID=3366070 RepID=UPI00381C4B81
MRGGVAVRASPVRPVRYGHRPTPPAKPLTTAGRRSGDLGPACALPGSSSGFRHWAVYDIPASVHEVSAGGGDADGKKLPSGARTSAYEAGRHGFLGAAPPPGEVPYRYMFVVHALDTPGSTSPRRRPSRGSVSGLCRTAWHALTPVFGIPARSRSGAKSEKCSQSIPPYVVGGQGGGNRWRPRAPRCWRPGSTVSRPSRGTG